METKSILKSKTFWVQVIAVLVGAATVITGPELEQYGITGVAQKWALSFIGLFTAIGTIYLRFTMTTPITPLKKKQQ